MAVSVPRWIDENTILVPATARSGDDVIGDGTLEITSDDPAFGKWAEWLELDDQPRPRR